MNRGPRICILTQGNNRNNPVNFIDPIGYYTEDQNPYSDDWWEPYGGYDESVGMVLEPSGQTISEVVDNLIGNLIHLEEII